MKSINEIKDAIKRTSVNGELQLNAVIDELSPSHDLYKVYADVHREYMLHSDRQDEDVEELMLTIEDEIIKGAMLEQGYIIRNGIYTSNADDQDNLKN